MLSEISDKAEVPSHSIKPPTVVGPCTCGMEGISRAVVFAISKLLQIAITIFIGIFFTILIASKSSQLEKNAHSQIERYINLTSYSQVFTSDAARDAVISIQRANLEHEAGLDLPFLPRQLKWTVNALLLDWGRAVSTNLMPVFSLVKTDMTLREVVLRYFPNTVLLAGASNLLIFIFGIPLALFLSRHYGSMVDRFVSMVAPLSSVPSWVLGVLLISVFAVQLRLLPVGGMLETRPPDNAWGYVPIILRHMFLPVLAIFLSMFFQLVTTWRTYFLIYAEEDYVELAKAKGLTAEVLERQYIFRPALTYVITSFALTLVGFWQAIMALEVVFDWPGLGWLYIKKALPNFWGESMYQGDLVIAVGVVVIFAYLLGTVVFLLDLIYLLVDPRVRFGSSSGSVPSKKPVRSSLVRSWRFKKLENWQPERQYQKADLHQSFHNLQDGVRSFLYGVDSGFRQVWGEIKSSPLALTGLAIILLLVMGSLYAIIALPYEKIGSSWDSETLTGRTDIPRLAQPAWTNFFRRDKLLSSQVISTRDATVSRSEQDLPNGIRIVTYDLAFDYPYKQAPVEINLYLDPKYQKKRPFISLTWFGPDGQKLDLKATAIDGPTHYNFEEGIPYKRMVWTNPHLKKWFVLDEVNPTPAHAILFADLLQDEPVYRQGIYHLRVSGMFFEKEGDVSADLVLLGQVYGAAGTDYLRRNLLVPLLWGLPFALLFGLIGAFVTTLLSMLVAASGVWFGGWVDSLTQRLTEANMIMPVLAISVLAHALLNISLWVILAVVVLLNIFGSPTKTFRAAFLQLKDASYIEAARAYGASSSRIIMVYLFPRIIPVLVPQLVTLIPSYVFLEATLGMFNIKSIYPTWGTVIYRALTKGALWGAPYWVLEPLGMLLLTGLAFAMLGYALERILNPRLRDNFDPNK